MLPVRSARYDLRLTEIGFGASQLGNLYRETSDADAAGAMDRAWDGGVRYFDVAPHYGLGLAERRLGRALGTRPREDFVISTKVGRLLQPAPDGVGLDQEGFVVPATSRRVWDLSRDGIRRSILESLDRLGLDRIDIAYLHDPDKHFDDAVRYALPALVELRDEGVVTAVGVGMNQSAMPARFLVEVDLDLVMVAGRYTLLEQGAADDLLPLAAERGVGVVVAGAYNSGLLATARPPVSARYDYGDAPEAVLARAHLLADVCERYGATLPQVALAFPLRHPSVVSVVVGARNARQMEGTLTRYAAPVPDDLWRELESLDLIPD